VRLFGALAVAFLPAALVGLVLGKTIKRLLFGPLPVAVALLVGGVLMIVVEHLRAKRGVQGESGTEHVTLKRALLIGFGQCFALWPGMSRSMSTIVAGQMAGLSTATAAEFSFLLSVPTLGAATVYEIYKSRQALAHGVGGPQMAVGLLVSFAVAWLVIAAFVRYLGRRGLAPFGYYRIALAVVVLAISL
jgi:undecaprenyl-diphosphatase